MSFDHDEHMELVEMIEAKKMPSWQDAGRGHRVAKPANKWWHAVAIGVIISIPFIVEILKNV